MIKTIISIFILLSGSYTYAQQSDCKVNLPAISGSYTGDCKKGLAQGKGIARGIDYYEGNFSKGLPEGKGLYKWANGSYYDGGWKMGMREGKGTFVMGDSITKGYWKEDKFVGQKPKASYKITVSRNIARSTITKTIESGNGVKIKLMMGGTENSQVEDLTLAYSSGTEYRNGATYGIQNTTLPLDVTVRYKTWNQLHTIQYEVLYEFIILDPGVWNVSVVTM